MNKKIVKIAIVGAVLAVAVDYFLKPSLQGTVGLK